MSILGTTSIRIDELDQVYPTVAEVDAMVGEAAKMIPALETARYIRAFAGVRPLVGSKAASDDRDVSRGLRSSIMLKTALKTLPRFPGAS